MVQEAKTLYWGEKDWKANQSGFLGGEGDSFFCRALEFLSLAFRVKFSNFFNVQMIDASITTTKPCTPAHSNLLHITCNASVLIKFKISDGPILSGELLFLFLLYLFRLKEIMSI